MNPDPVPPVRRLLTHVIPDGLVRREAGISPINEREDGTRVKRGGFIEC